MKIWRNEGIQCIGKYIALVIALNYMSELTQEYSNDLLVVEQVSDNQQTIQRSVFSSFQGLMLVKKSMVLLLSWLMIQMGRMINKKKETVNKMMGGIQSFEKLSQNEGGNQLKQGGDDGLKQSQDFSSHQEIQSSRSQVTHHEVDKDQISPVQYSEQISSKTQSMLGILSFNVIVLFAQLQQTINVYFIVYFKCIGFILTIIIIHFVFKSYARIDNRSIINTSLWLKLFIAIPIIACAMLIKLQLAGLPSFYMTNLATSQQTPTYEAILKILSVILMDLAFFVILFIQKFKLLSSVSYHHDCPLIPIAPTPQKLLISTSKYVVLGLLIFTILTGQFFTLISFVFKHPFTAYLLVKVAITYFAQQYITYFILIHYDQHIFFSVLTMVGIHSRIYDYTFKYWNKNSLMTLGLFLPYLLLLINITKTNKKVLSSLN